MPRMFSPIGSLPPPQSTPTKRKEADDDDADGSKLNRLMAKLLLQHEDTLRAAARDDNFVLAMAEDSPLAKALEAGAAEYKAKGEESRSKAKDAGDTYMGHPAGKKPDAMLRMLIFRLAEAIGHKKTELEAATATDAPCRAALELVATVGAQGANMKLQATRCFWLSRDNVVKWIFACNAELELKGAFHILRAKRVLEVVGVELMHDFAPRSKAAREIEEQVFRKKQAKKKKSG